MAVEEKGKEMEKDVGGGHTVLYKLELHTVYTQRGRGSEERLNKNTTCLCFVI